MAESVRDPLRNIPIQTIVDGVEVTGRILVLWPNYMTVIITSPASGLAAGVHVPHFAMYPQNRLATHSEGRAVALTERGQRKAEELLKELHEHSQGRGSGWRVYAHNPSPVAQEASDSSTFGGRAATDSRRVPATVETGVLSQHEFDSVPPEHQALIEESTMGLRAVYGDDWLRQERDRLRSELEFAFGVDLD